MPIKTLSSSDQNFAQHFNALLDRKQGLSTDKQITTEVETILQRVRQQGDAALLDYTRQFDHFSVTAAQLEIPQRECEQAFATLAADLKTALQLAEQRIRHFHQQQIPQSWQMTSKQGSTLGQRVMPLQRVGLYVPGGQAAYPSSVLMNAIPAKVAGVEEMIMVTPTPNAQSNPLVLAAAHLAGVDRVFRIGGAQAIAALAFGTETIPKVDKITGPGNAYVANAKRQVFGTVGIDMIAGPSELLILADDSADPDWIALDLFAQAEHDESAQVICISESPTLLEQIQLSVNKLLPDMPRGNIIRASLDNNGALILSDNLTTSIDLANQIAAEHVQIVHQQARSMAQQIKHAGAIFIGAHSAESLGDYCIGPNHVLPTSGTARFSSGLGVEDFIKRSSVIELSVSEAQHIAPHAQRLAQAEGLSAHAASAAMRGANATTRE